MVVVLGPTDKERLATYRLFQQIDVKAKTVHDDIEYMNTLKVEFMSLVLQSEADMDVFMDCITRPKNIINNCATRIDNNKNKTIESEDTINEASNTNATDKNSGSTFQITSSLQTLSFNTNTEQQQQHELKHHHDINKTAMSPDSSKPSSSMLDPTNAGLFAKKLFAAYRLLALQEVSTHSIDKNTLVDLNTLLAILLQYFPSSIIGAACAGGKEGVENSLQSLLTLNEYYPDEQSPLPFVTNIVITGCTGCLYEPFQNRHHISQQRVQIEPNHRNNSSNGIISKGHRRKFIRALVDWDIFNCFLTKILIHDNNYTLNQLACEGIFDSVVAIIDSIAHPMLASATSSNLIGDTDDSVGEELLLSCICSKRFVEKLVALASTTTHIFASTSSARLLLACYESAAGFSRKKIETTSTNTSSLNNRTDDDGAINAKAVKESLDPTAITNKFMRFGLVAKFHNAIVSQIHQIVQGLDIQVLISKIDESDISSTGEGGNRSSVPVKHPGRCIIERPFTSRRLSLITLLADLVTFEGNMDGSSKSTMSSALDAIVSLPTISLDSGPTDTTFNPFWSGLCVLLFDYPENNMFQVQFYRLLLGLCLTNHEQSLKLLVQKSKFITRAVNAFHSSNAQIRSNRGVLLRCLNALRLHAQSLPSQSFLRHYLDSHDQWKSFQEELLRMTIEQVLPGGGLTVPVSSVEASTSLVVDTDLDLGSAFAKELGFPPSRQKIVDADYVLPTNDGLSSSKKKKKRKK